MDKEPNGGKLNLNLNAKSFVPKSYGGYGNNPQGGQMNMQNPYMGFDPNNPYGGYYGNQGMGMYGQQMGMYGGYYQPMPGNFQQPQFQNPQQFQQPQQPAEQPQVQEEDDGGVVGMKKKKKGKKGQQPAAAPVQSSPKPQQPPVQTLNQNQNFGFNQGNKGQNKPKDKKDAPKPQPQKKEAPKPQPKPAPKKAEEKKDKEKDVKEVTKGVEEMNLDNKELEEDSFEGKMIEVDKTRQPLSIVFIGHVDSGKSTISGSLLYNLGQIDERTIEKYQREAKVHNRESWFMAYIMDVNEEEKEKGKTVEIGKAFFETKTKRFTLLDAPGHAGYIPNLLQGACQADYAGLV